MTESLLFRPIGVIRTPFGETEVMPIQAGAALGVPGRIELDPTLVEGPAMSIPRIRSPSAACR